jgi:hypothetical protein
LFFGRIYRKLHLKKGHKERNKKVVGSRAILYPVIKEKSRE